ncbi:amylosucrase [Magnetococcus sp. PR-3]|uniref:amylosucrase n=1 Tax=Magnetococcus sp. PR-3 TaxID=3120355 RepID=UPI002FCE0E12
MSREAWYSAQSATTLERLLPRIETRFAERMDPNDWAGLVQRLHTHFDHLFNNYYRLYGQRYDFFYHLEELLYSTIESWLSRPEALKGLDAIREQDSNWFDSNRMVGAMAYVDLLAGDLQGVVKRIPYLKELSISYLHLMPLFRTPEGDDDGGYAVSSYREVDPSLGTMEQLAELAEELRRNGISLAVDFILNHTADDHPWAISAKQGDITFQNYYRLFPDREEPDAFEAHTQSIFPDEHPGCFTYSNRMKKWVWTTFHNYQWDLNYENPEVFNAMAGEMIFLANIGAELLRFDATPFLWKRKGTDCQNQPEVHWIIQAFNGVARIAAPTLVFKSEAIVHPDDVSKFLSPQECQLSYNPQLMALVWETLATRDTRLMRQALGHRFITPADCAWVNYLRCHDDIGWAFADDDMAAVDIDIHGHRHFLTQFYTGRFENTFARGQPFQENPNTGDARVSGTLASLCGLEKALFEQNQDEVDLAIRRILMLHGVILTIGGIPLLYLGDELGMINDYSYNQDPEKDGDSRWLHRLPFNEQAADQRHDLETVPGQIFSGLQRLIQIRLQNLAFTRAETEVVDLENTHVLGFFRQHMEHSALVLANFSEKPQKIDASRLRQLGLKKTFTDLVSGHFIVATSELMLEPYQIVILMVAR